MPLFTTTPSTIDLLIACGVLVIFAVSLAYWIGRGHQQIIDRRRETQARQHIRALLLIHHARHLKRQRKPLQPQQPFTDSRN